MISTPGLKTNRFGFLFALLISVAPFFSKAQQKLKTTDFVLYGKKITMASTITVAKGAIGARSLIQTTGGVTFGSNLTTNRSNLYSDSAVVLYSSNVVNGVIKAKNTSVTTGLPINIGSGANLKDSVVGKGNITITSGTVKQVFLPTGNTYSGPTPTAGPAIKVAAASLNFPVLPSMPATIPIDHVGTTNVTATGPITPNYYGDLLLSGGQTVTFSGTGVYVFKSIKNTGTNTFVFDFKNITGNFVILVQGDVDLSKNSVSTINGGGANYIFLETLGNGSSASGYSFTMANGTTGGDYRWLGTVWAPNGNITLSNQGTKGTILGACFTNNTINVTTNALIDYAPYINVSNANNPLIVPSFTPPVIGRDESIIGPQLTYLQQNWDGTATFEDSVFRVINSNVLIDIIVTNGQLAYLQSILPNAPYNMVTPFITNGGQNIITGFYPIANLGALNALGSTYINYVRPVSPPKKNSGLTTSGGDIAQRSNIVRDGYHTNGENVTVGVLSDSYNNLGLANADVVNDDLPGTGNTANPDAVNVLQDYPYTVFNSASDEGRAMLQIVHDVAPKAKLAFRTGFISEGDFALGVRQLADNANCDIIVDDITYITEPFFRDGFVAQSANYVHDHNKTYISAAGNFGGQSYSANFNPVAAPNGMTGYAHNFSSSGTDIYQKLNLTAGIYTMVLQWDNDFYSLGQANPSPNDLDWYLVNDNGGIIFGMNMNNFHRDPIEVLSFQALANTTANLMVISYNGSTNVKFKYIIMRGGATIAEYPGGPSTIVGQANAAGALAVGAARYTRTPAFGVTPPVIESFSSIGGTPVNGVLRNKPDFSAPDGGNTTVNLGPSLNLEPGESPVYPNFFGTSAAAPHAGGVAALLMSGSQKFRGTRMGPDEIKSLLQSTAIDMMSTVGRDDTSGSGLIQADAAMNTFANPTPGLITVSVPNNITGPTTSSFTVTVTGHFFTSSSVIYERDQPLTTTTILNDSTATATIDGFTGNPAIRVYTPPISALQTDGKFSNAINLLNIPKKKVVITADNKAKLYGDPLPQLTSTITVDGVLLANTQPLLSLSDLGLDNGRLQYTTPATTLSDATNYAIVPAMNPPFDPVNSSADEILDESYQYTFVNGALTVNKLPLTITPNDQTITYGDALAPVTYSYSLGSNNISGADATTIQSNLLTEYQGSVINNTFALVDSKLITSNFSFSNVGFVATQNSISSSKLITSNFNVISLSADLFNSYSNSQSDLVNSKLITSGKLITSSKLITSGKLITSSSTVFNAAIGDSAATDNSIVIIDNADVDAGQVNTFIPTNLITGLSVGQSNIVPAAFFTADPFSRNFDIHYALGKLTINPAGLTVKANDANKVYGATDPTLSYTLTGLKYLDDQTVVTGVTLTTTTGANATAGQHPIVPSGGTAANYNLNYTNGTLTVTKAPLTAKVSDASRVYGDPNPTFTFTYTGFVYLDNATAVTTAPTVSTAAQTANVGTYAMVPSGGSAANYAFTTYLNGTLTITPAPLTVTADNQVIFQGASLPTFTSTYTGFKNSDNPGNSFTSGPVYTVSPAYSGKAGVYTINVAGIVQKQSPANYSPVTYVAGTLYVDPKGGNTKNVKPSLICVEPLVGDPSGYPYVAHYSINNPNTTTVFVAVGDSNLVTPKTGFTPQPPTVFPPGTITWDMKFDGNPHTYSITTFNGNGMATSTTSSASSTSGKCGSTVTQRASNVEESILLNKMGVYPNPAHNTATLVIGAADVSLKDIRIIDVAGRVFPVSLRNSSTQTVELNLSTLINGVYFIKVNLKDQVKLFKIEKM